jgi:predicted transcriptional regulator
MESSDLIALTADIVSSHVSHNNVSSADLPTLIANVYGVLAKTASPAEPEIKKAVPAVTVRSSVKHDYIVCLEDGKKLKMLKRYLRTNYNMTPEDYRAKWNLPRDYPMIASAYADKRRTLAQSSGLGRKKAVVLDATAPPATKIVEPAAKRRVGRPAKPKADTAPKATGKSKAATALKAPAKSRATKMPKGIVAAKAAAQDHLTGGSTPIES